MKTTFIYALCEPGTRTVRYIGKANNPSQRLKTHLCTSIKMETHLGRWLRTLAPVTPSLVVLREVSSERWKSSEQRYIRISKSLGMRLTNSTDGGEGLNNPSLETRVKIGSANKGRLSGKRNPFFGLTHTAAVREIIRKVHLNRPLADVHKKKISASMKGHIKSQSHREALSIASKISWLRRKQSK